MATSALVTDANIHLLPTPSPPLQPGIDKGFLITVGLLLAIIGNVILSVGLNIQKHAHITLQASGEQYIRSGLWWMGLTTMVIGECGNFMAYGFAPATMVAPLGAVGVIANLVVAHFLRKENIRARDLIGSILIVSGGIMLVVYSPHSEVILDIDELLKYIFSPVFEIYSGLLILLFIATVMVAKRMTQRSVVMDLFLCAIVGSVTVMATKGFSTSIRLTILGDENAFLSPVTYIMAVIIVVTAVLQIRFLNQAMRHFGTSQVVPIYYVMFTLATIFGGIVLYREFKQLMVTEEVSFFVGLVVTFVGVHLVNADREEEEEQIDPADDQPMFGELKETQRLEGILLGGGLGLGIGLILAPMTFNLFVLTGTLVGIGIGGMATESCVGTSEKYVGPGGDSESEQSFSLFV